MCDFKISSSPDSTFQVLTPQKSLRYWFGQKNIFWRLLHKEFELEKKRANSNFQVKCEYQTTTNIAFLCKMVRVPISIVYVLRIPHQTLPFRYGLTKKRLRHVLIWTKQTFFEDFYIESLNWKRKRSNSNLRGKCEYQTTTNIAFLCNMLRVPFLLCAIWKFPTRKYFSGIESPKKASGLWFDQKIILWRLLHGVL